MYLKAIMRELMQCKNICISKGTQIVKIITLLLCWVAIIIATVVTAPLWLPLFIIRYSEAKLYKWRYDADRFHPEEIMWLHGSPKNLMVINALAMFQNKVDIKSLQKQMKDIIHSSNSRYDKYSRLTKYVQFGRLNNYWIEENNFDITQHVYEWNENDLYNEDELQKTINSIAILPLINERQKSPWEMILIHFKCNKNHVKSAMLLRCNHALADGASIIYFLTNILNQSNIKTPNVRQLTTSQKFLIKLKGFIRLPFVLLRITFMMSSKKNTLNPKSVIGRKTYEWSKPINLNLIKSIKNKMKVTVNDVLTGCLASQIYQCLKHHDGKVPSNYQVFLPADTRLSLKEANGLTNKFGILFFNLPISTSDPIKTTKHINYRMKSVKNSAEAFSVRYEQRLAGEFLPEFLYKFFNKNAIKKGEMVVSNVPGPQETIIIANTPVEFFTFWPPQSDDVGSSVSFFSYQGKVVVGFCSDDAIKINPKEFLNMYENNIKTLAKMVDEDVSIESD